MNRRELADWASQNLNFWVDINADESKMLTQIMKLVQI